MRNLKIPRQAGQIIRESRLEKGLTQEQLASLSNTSRSLIYRIEKGATNGVMFDKLFDVFAALDLELAVVDMDSAARSASDNKDASSAGIAAPLDAPSPSKSSKIAASKKCSSRNSKAQLEKELKAIKNIAGFDADRFLGA